jgi:arginase family enzyme
MRSPETKARRTTEEAPVFPEEMLEKWHVTVPGLDVTEHGEAIVVRNDVIGTRFEGSRALRALFETFRRPRPLKDALAANVEPEHVMAALMNAFIMDVDVLYPTVASGIGRSTKLSRLLAKQETRADVVVFGATTDSAATGRAGARHGASAIRSACTLPFLETTVDAMANPFRLELGPGDVSYLDLEMRRRYAKVPSLADVGDVRIMPGESIHTYGARVKALAGLILDEGSKPAMLGGDHSATWFVLDALLERLPGLGIIHFDAHHDAWPPLAPQFNYVNHGNPFCHALKSPALKVLHQLGLRTFEPAFDATLKRDSRVSYWSARELQKLSPEAAFEHLPREIPYYLTFDVDCLAPSLAPETGTPEPGGLTYYQAFELVDHAARHFDLVGFDLMEVSQSEEHVNHAARIAARLLGQLVLGASAFEPLVTYVRES